MKGPSKRIGIYFKFLPVSIHSLQIRSQSSRFILTTPNSDNLMGARFSIFILYVENIFSLYFEAQIFSAELCSRK